MKKIQSNDYFFCYNPKLSNHFWKKGIKYIIKAIDPDNNRMFTMYLKSKELQLAINEYKNQNK